MAQTIAKRLSEKIQANRDLKIEITRLKGIIKDRDSMILGLTTENGILEREVKEWNRKQREGYCWWIKDSEGIILDMGEVPAYSQFTFPRPIPKEIGTPKYRKLPFYLEEQGITKIHTKKYMRYNSI